MKTKKKRPTSYDKGEHELICTALHVSPDPDAPGLTAYEAVCVLMEKLEVARYHIGLHLGKIDLQTTLDEEKPEPDLAAAWNYINKPSDDFCVLKMYGY